jgi:hypothetical protein
LASSSSTVPAAASEDQDARAKAVVDELVAIVFSNGTHFKGLRNAFGMFAPREVPGFYVLNGMLDVVEAALPRLRLLVERVEATPEALRGWLTTSMQVHDFRPSTSVAADDAIVVAARARGFDHRTDVFVRIHLVYVRSAASEVWYRDVHVRNVKSGGTPLGAERMRDTYMPDSREEIVAELERAGFPRALLELSVRAGSVDPSAPEKRAMARSLLERTTCTACRAPASRMCGGCKFARYCSSECQRADWRTKHKQSCRTWAAMKKMLLMGASGV